MGQQRFFCANQFFDENIWLVVQRGKMNKAGYTDGRAGAVMQKTLDVQKYLLRTDRRTKV